jgi:hypothetical protein
MFVRDHVIRPAGGAWKKHKKMHNPVECAASDDLRISSCTVRAISRMLQRHHRLMPRSSACLGTVLLLTVLFAGEAAQTAQRKVVVGMFTATW